MRFIFSKSNYIRLSIRTGKAVIYMDIALLSMALSQGQVQQQASISVMKQVMDQAESSTDGLTKMLETASVAAIQHAAQPYLGGNIDIKG